MAYNRYRGNSGRRERMEEPPVRGDVIAPLPREEEPPPPETECTEEKTSSEMQRELRGSLDGILKRLDPGRLETEDLLILAILWLAYRSSGDKELLIALGAYLLM